MREMKDSGIEWIGAIPQDWKTDRLQWHLKEINVSNNPIQTKNILSLTIETGVIPYAEKGNQGNKAKEDYSQYKIALPDTLVINSMNVIIGAVGISQYFGCVSPVYYVFEPIEGTDLRYIYYLFTNTGFQKEMRKYAKGILEIRLRISSNDMLKRIVPSPPFKEQQRIADYLDKMCAEIDAVLEKTRASIEEYKKLKQAVITQAVTKGIRGDRPMKDSGIEWIGEIPAEWSVVRQKYFWNTIESGVSVNAADKPVDNSEQYGVLKTSAVSKFMFIPTEHKQVNLEEYGRVSCPVRADSIIASRMNTPELVGACGYVQNNYPNLFLPDRLWQTTFKDELSPKYAWYYLSGIRVRQYISSLSTGTSSSMQNISQSQYGNIFITIPSIGEQSEIAKYLDEKCNSVDALIAKKQQYLIEIENYKKSLIYEYVTGKKEVKTSVLAD